MVLNFDSSGIFNPKLLLCFNVLAKLRFALNHITKLYQKKFRTILNYGLIITK